MYAETIATRNTVATQVRALAQMGRPRINITLDDDAGSYMRTYTTRDTIKGEVVITAASEIRFDLLQINLEGMYVSIFGQSMCLVGEGGGPTWRSGDAKGADRVWRRQALPKRSSRGPGRRR